MDKKRIAIGICTYKRNALLENALNHITKLVSPQNVILEVIISDNNPDKIAESVFFQLASSYPFKLHYLHEAKKGIAAARNRVLNGAININANYVAFLDDDEFPSENWIVELYQTMLDFKADGATGATVPFVEGAEISMPSYLKHRKNGSIRKVCITNNVLFNLDIVTKSNIWFDDSFGSMTGEDIDFFYRATQNGYKFVWNNKVTMFDIIQEERLTLEWKMRRIFNDGYLKSFMAKKRKKNLYLFYLKILFNLLIFTLLGLVIYAIFRKNNRAVLYKWQDCFGKINGFLFDKPYDYYK